ncbi:hypothetical protein [Thermogemmatispora tikiterensis]|uniref:Uncharacterized protein n=1 Tax=Thermogemmatispora tikiterensis TaxID=1825093 RepID=A0A328V925_9CHLR|nr:hypothetical protein [Thermogemmatispora tikiterensis]RAQ94048.1 hypothetical protein A4R35_00790 [Thermogemmatispora tikiterensis]
MKQQYERDDQAGQRVRERNWLRVVTITTTLCTDSLLLLLAWLCPSLLWYELVSVLCLVGIGTIFMGGSALGEIPSYEVARALTALRSTEPNAMARRFSAIGAS